MPFPDESLTAAVVDYQPTWPADFATLAEELGGLLGDRAAAIDHVGSTSVPGLPAKDCIDVQVQVDDLDEKTLVSRMEKGGYRCRPEPWNRVEVTNGHEFRKLVFAPKEGARTANVHVRETGAPNAQFALLFRNFLRADPQARQAWGAFKQRLAASVPDLFAYGQIKAPATEILMLAATRWANEHAG
jgi:GrpB-like predicted nucleotidyltransferase (UPF0157 family)